MATRDRQVVRFGPWPKGLNQRLQVAGQRYAGGLDELFAATNLEYNDDGSIHPRRGIKILYSSITPANDNWSVFKGGKSQIIGSVYGSIALGSAGGKTYYVGFDGLRNWFYGNDPTDPSVVAAGQIKTAGNPDSAGFSPTCLFQYNGNVYFVRDPANGLSTLLKLTWAQFIGVANWAPVATAQGQRGNQAFILKERAFIVDYLNSRIYWSKATDPETWNAPDGGNVQINPGDNDVIIGCVVADNVIYVFKYRSIYKFGFTSDPAVDGSVVLLNDNLGGAPVEYNNIVYFAGTDGNMYRLSGNQNIPIAPQMQFISRPYSSVWGSSNFLPFKPFILDDTLYMGWSIDFISPSFSNNESVYYSMNLRNGACAKITLQTPVAAGFDYFMVHNAAAGAFPWSSGAGKSGVIIPTIWGQYANFWMSAGKAEIQDLGITGVTVPTWFVPRVTFQTFEWGTQIDSWKRGVKSFVMRDWLVPSNPANFWQIRQNNGSNVGTNQFLFGLTQAAIGFGQPARLITTLPGRRFIKTSFDLVDNFNADAPFVTAAVAGFTDNQVQPNPFIHHIDLEVSIKNLLTKRA